MKTDNKKTNTYKNVGLNCYVDSDYVNLRMHKNSI